MSQHLDDLDLADLVSTKERPYATFQNKINILYVCYRKNNVAYMVLVCKTAVQSWKNFLVSPITKSTIVHIYEMG